MDIPRAEDRGDGGLNMYAAGQCAACGMVKMSINGVRQCPRCDTKSKTRSGKVNHVKSAPASAFMKVKRKALDGTEYIEMVAKSKEDMQKEIQVGKAEVIPSSTLQQAQILKDTIDDPKTIAVNPLEFFKYIEAFFDSRPAKTLQEFKKIDKLRKAVKKLRTQVEEYIGGK